jgi:LAO/AO transport system kinase
MSEATDQQGAGLRTTRELAQAISSVERGGPAADALIQTALTRLASERSQNAVVIGVTGPPGAGKSTLVGALAEIARAAGRRVAILAVDPSSVQSGGALLGDRVRVEERPGDEGRFVRSIATRGSGRSLSHTAAAASLLVEAAGFHCLRQLDYSKYDFDFTIKNNSGATQRKLVSRTLFFKFKYYVHDRC